MDVCVYVVPRLGLVQAQLQRLRQQQQPSSSAVLQQLEAVAENASDASKVPNGQPKMFRSHLSRLQSQEERERDRERESGGAVNGSAINVTRSNSKLKPVKERRPTALPSEAPNVGVSDTEEEEEEVRVNVNSIIDEAAAPATPTTPTAAKANVKFFIGHTQEANADVDADDTLSNQSSDANNNNSNSNSNEKLANGTLPTAGEQEQRLATLTSPKAATAKSSSNVSLNYLRRSRSTMGISAEPASQPAAAQRRRVSTMPDINIPPPPPPPPAELLKPVTPLHLCKKRSAERQREEQQQQQQLDTPPTPTADDLNMTSSQVST